MRAIAILLLSAAHAQQVDIFDVVAVDNNAPGSASYQLGNTGTGFYSTSHTTSAFWTWLKSGLNSDYQVRATLQSGITPGGDSLNSWLALSTTRQWQLSVGLAGGAKDCILLIEIRRVADLVVIDSATVEISVG